MSLRNLRSTLKQLESAEDALIAAQENCIAGRVTLEDAKAAFRRVKVLLHRMVRYRARVASLGGQRAVAKAYVAVAPVPAELAFAS